MNFLLDRYRTKPIKMPTQTEFADAEEEDVKEKIIQWCGRCRSAHEMPECEFIALPSSEGGHIPDFLYLLNVNEDEEEEESICWCPRCKELKYEGDDVCCRCGRCFEGECKHYACDCVVETDEEEEEEELK